VTKQTIADLYLIVRILCNQPEESSW